MLVVEGLVEGEVLARERVEVRATGRITAAVRTPSLVLEEGGSLEGRIEMTTQEGVRGDARRRPRRPPEKRRFRASSRLETQSIFVRIRAPVGPTAIPCGRPKAQPQCAVPPRPRSPERDVRLSAGHGPSVAECPERKEKRDAPPIESVARAALGLGRGAAPCRRSPRLPRTASRSFPTVPTGRC